MLVDAPCLGLGRRSLRDRVGVSGSLDHPQHVPKRRGTGGSAVLPTDIGNATSLSEQMSAKSAERKSGTSGVRRRRHAGAEVPLPIAPGGRWHEADDAAATWTGAAARTKGRRKNK